MRLPIFVFALSLFLLTDAKIKKKPKHEKSEDWDEIGDMLKQIDELDGTGGSRVVTGELAEEDADAFDVDEDDERSAEKALRENPCEDHHCGWGKECMLNKQNEPHCQCIRECPRIPNADQFDRVCSNQNETYDSLCDLYRERCLCRRGDSECGKSKHKNVHLEYLGACKKLTECTEEHLEQFPARMSDWLFQVMRDLDKRKELHGDDWISMIEEAEGDEHLKHVYPVIWKFCDLDAKPHDKEVTHHELIPITAPVMPMESCIKPFLKRCDTNDNNKISLQEWGKCLGLKKGNRDLWLYCWNSSKEVSLIEGEIIERC